MQTFSDSPFSHQPEKSKKASQKTQALPAKTAIKRFLQLFTTVTDAAN
jgi:hypothetical protein